MGISEVDHKHNEHAYSSTQNLEKYGILPFFLLLTFILTEIRNLYRWEVQLLKQGLISIFLNKEVILAATQKDVEVKSI